MSTGAKTPIAQIMPVVNRVIEGIAPACTRVEIAGSIRRKQKMVGDVELVVIPDGDKLYTLLDQRLATGKISHTTPKRWGEKYRAFIFNGTKFDVFIQPDPATFATNLMIRTGCAEFSQAMVTQRSNGGFCPDCYVVKYARIWDSDGAAVDTPEESDIFRLWGMEMPPPEQRTAKFVPVWLDVDVPPTAPRNSASDDAIPVPPLDDFDYLWQPNVYNVDPAKMARAGQVVEESKSWPLPMVGREEAMRRTRELIELNRKKLKPESGGVRA